MSSKTDPIRHRRTTSTRTVRIFFFAALALFVARPAAASVLRDYVAQADGAYAYTLKSVTPGAGYTIHNIELTSQAWRAPGEVDRTLWKHALAIVVPNTVGTETTMLWITNGLNGDALTVPSADLQLTVQIALASRSVVAVLAQVPNQPITFDGDPAKSYIEDALVAFSWDRAMDTGDYTWAVYLPMVKSAVRAMDAVQDYLPGAVGRSARDFVAVGFSKRGAAAWLTGAVDTRVRALAPGVFDILNIDLQLEHHFKAYGFYSPAIEEYVDFDVIRRMRIPEGQRLLEVVDPLSYRHALAKPKFLLNAPGDQFYVPDSQRFYLHKLEGETLSRYVPNTDHSMSTSTGGVNDALFSLVSWYQSIVLNVPRPQLQWSVTGSQLRVTSNTVPLVARAWQASNSTARDFRKLTIGEAWTSTPLAPATDGSYSVNLSAPGTGWNATFVELVFAGPAGIPQTYSTQVYITPDVLPFTLTDPLRDPKHTAYWDHAVDRALNDPNSPLHGYFPFPVFGRSIASLAKADRVFDPMPPWRQDRALQECLAARLNVASGEFGWYTPVRRQHQTRPLWQWWNDAHEAYTHGRADRAEAICETLNAARH